MLEKSCGWWPIWYLLFFCHGGAEGQLQWDVKEKVTDYGQNVTLFCPVENCCSEVARWSVGQESIFIDLKKYSNDSSKKYGGTYNKDGFGVVIRNLSEADLNVTHRCDYGFIRSTPKYLLHDDVFIESTGQLQWDVKEKVTDYGQNVTLFCPVENCCSELAGWSVGQESIFIDLKKYSNDSSKKYGGTYNKDGFGVVIRNLSEADLNVTHRCDYGFNRSTPKYLLHDDVFIESTDVPDKDKDKDNNTVAENDTVTESNTVAENNTVAIVIPIVVAIVVIVVVAIILYRRKNKKKKPEGNEEEMIPLHTSGDQIKNEQDLEEINEADDLDLHEAIVKKYRTKPKIPKDFLNDKDFLRKLLKECGKNTEGLLPYSSEGIDVVYFLATLLVVVMKYGPKTEIVDEVLKDMSTTLTSQSPSTVVIIYHRSVKTAMEKVYKDCKKPIDKEDCEKPKDKEDCEKPKDKEDCEKPKDKEDGEKPKDKEDGEKPIVKEYCEKPIDKEDCEKQIEIFRKFIEKHKFDYSASSCLQQCIDKSRQ